MFVTVRGRSAVNELVDLTPPTFNDTDIEEQRSNIESVVRRSQFTSQPIRVGVDDIDYDDQSITYSISTEQIDEIISTTWYQIFQWGYFHYSRNELTGDSTWYISTGWNDTTVCHTPVYVTNTGNETRRYRVCLQQCLRRRCDWNWTDQKGTESWCSATWRCPCHWCRHIPAWLCCTEWLHHSKWGYRWDSYWHTNSVWNDWDSHTPKWEQCRRRKCPCNRRWIGWERCQWCNPVDAI